MKRVIRGTVLLCMVFLLIAAMASITLAKPVKPAAAAPTATTYVYADDPGWVKTGSWAVEDYAFEGGPKLLVANDAGAGATYTFDGKYKNYEVYASKYWTCGNVEVWVDGAKVATVDLRLDADAATYDNLIASGKFPGNPHNPHTVMIKALGTGGPGIITYTDEYGTPQSIDLSWVHFVNVQYVKVY